MACSVCSANVEKKLQSLEGINSASVSLASRTALVDYNPDIITLEDMKREISNAGYDLVIENDRSVEEINRREFTLLRRRTLASWLFAILTMCFSMGWISLGMEQNMAHRRRLVEPRRVHLGHRRAATAGHRRGRGVYRQDLS